MKAATSHFVLASAVRWTPALVCLFVAGNADAQMGPSQWRFSTSFQEVGSEDTRSVFVGDDGAELDQVIVDSLGVSLSFYRPSPRGQLSLSGRASATRFRDLGALDNVPFGAGIIGDYQLSSRTRINFHEAFSSGFNLERLSSVGLLPSRLGAEVSVGGLGFSVRHSPRTTSFLSFTHNWIDYDSPQTIDASRFVVDRPLDEGDAGLPPAETTPAPTPEQGPESGPGENVFTPPDGQDLGLDVLSSEGLTDPRLSSLFGGATFGVSRQLTSRTQANFRLNYGWRSFFHSSTDTDGAQYGGQTGLTRRVRANDRLYVSYNYRRSDSQIPATNHHTLLGGWGRLVGTQTNVFVSGGTSYFHAVGRESQPSLFVNTGMTWTRESTSFALRYKRSVTQAFGFGRSYLTDWATANFRQMLGRKLSFAAMTGYSLGRDALAEQREFSAARADGELSYWITNGVSVGGRYFIGETTSSVQGDEDKRRYSLWSFFVTYDHLWP